MTPWSQGLQANGENIYLTVSLLTLFTVTSEPATCMGVVIPLALREAITTSRLESGYPSNIWFNIGTYRISNKGFLKVD